MEWAFLVFRFPRPGSSRDSRAPGSTRALPLNGLAPTLIGPVWKGTCGATPDAPRCIPNGRKSLQRRDGVCTQPVYRYTGGARKRTLARLRTGARYTAGSLPWPVKNAVSVLPSSVRAPPSASLPAPAFLKLRALRPMSDPNLNIRLPAELKARVAAQAESLGRTLSDHSRAIIAEHFDGPDLGALREQLGDLAEQVTRLAETSQVGSGGGGAERGALIDLATEVAEMKAMNRELAATVHNALRIIVYRDGRGQRSQDSD